MSLKEVLLEIGGFPYRISRRIEESDLPFSDDYIPFLITSVQDRLEVFFACPQIIEKVKERFGQEIAATGEVSIHRPRRKIDRIYLSVQRESTPLERKAWLEEILTRINPMVLDYDIWLSTDQKEYYVYHLPPDWHLKNPGTEIIPVVLS